MEAKAPVVESSRESDQAVRVNFIARTAQQYSASSAALERRRNKPDPPFSMNLNRQLKGCLRRVELLMELRLRATECHLTCAPVTRRKQTHPAYASQIGRHLIYLPRRNGRLS